MFKSHHLAHAFSKFLVGRCKTGDDNPPTPAVRPASAACGNAHAAHAYTIRTIHAYASNAYASVTPVLQDSKVRLATTDSDHFIRSICLPLEGELTPRNLLEKKRCLQISAETLGNVCGASSCGVRPWLP